MMQLSAISIHGNGRPCDCLVIVDLPVCVCVCESFCVGLGLGVLDRITWKYKSGNQTTNALRSLSLKMKIQGRKKFSVRRCHK